MVIIGLCFLLIEWLLFGEGGTVRLKLDFQGQGGGRMLDVDGQGGWGSWNLDNFHGCHICIIPQESSILKSQMLFLFFSNKWS